MSCVTRRSVGVTPRNRKEPAGGRPDSIRKELTLSAPRERVWRALTDPEQLLRWFPTHSAEIDLKPGGRVRFAWQDSRDEGEIVEVAPNERLVFRWRVEGSERPYTRVTVTLDDLAEGGTRLVLVEDGFSSLADDERRGIVAGNDQGWTEELEELVEFVGSQAA